MSRSATRMMIASATPRKYPATMPSTAPRMSESSIDAMPTVSEMRPASMRRVMTSRPYSSVPSG